MKDRLIELARRDSPLETVGLLGGTADELLALAPANNHSPTPQVAFYVEPDTVGRASEVLRLAGHEVVGFYHSHPGGRRGPSKSDSRLCPDEWIMLIIGGDDFEDLSAWVNGRKIKLVEKVPSLYDNKGL